LTEAQLLTICNSPPEDPMRGHVLILRRIIRGKRSKALHQIFGEEPPLPPTPNYGTFTLIPANVSHLTSGMLVYEDNEESFSSSLHNKPSAADLIQSENAKKKAKRASTVSVLSGLGVQDPEAIPDSPSQSNYSKSSTTMKRGPSKLRNFFGQRPPSELITTHLADYFPFTEKKVLERTRRQSMLSASKTGTGKRDSNLSLNAPATSRFSVSTQGSHRPISTVSSRTSFSSLAADRFPFPQVQATETSTHETSETAVEEPPPRVSLSTDDGSEIDINGMDSDSQPQSTSKRMSNLHLLPPVKFPSESLSESMNDFTGDVFASAIGQTSSKASSSSKRMSLIMELRSKRDRSDAASLMTVDEITVEVESRRETGLPGEKESSDEWTKVDLEDGSKLVSDEGEILKSATLESEDVPVAVAEIDTYAEGDDDMDYMVDGEDVEDELMDGDEPGKAITSQQGGLFFYLFIFFCILTTSEKNEQLSGLKVP
jgi:mitogen-activated protein kinase kinase kinase